MIIFKSRREAVVDQMSSIRKLTLDLKCPDQDNQNSDATVGHCRLPALALLSLFLYAWYYFYPLLAMAIVVKQPFFSIGYVCVHGEDCGEMGKYSSESR